MITNPHLLRVCVCVRTSVMLCARRGGVVSVLFTAVHLNPLYIIFLPFFLFVFFLDTLYI